MKYLLLWLALALVVLQTPADAQTVGPAVVQPDASLVIAGRRFVLADIELIPTRRLCDSRRPPVCDTLAAVALRSKTEHFVSCRRRTDLPNPEAAPCSHTVPDPEPGRPVPGNWKPFFDLGLAPSFEHIDYVARAVTPHWRTIRFNARFFMVDHRHVSGDLAGSGELLDLTYVPLPETASLELSLVTLRVRRPRAWRAAPKSISMTRASEVRK